MPIFQSSDIAIHYQIDGDPDGAPIVFSNSLGSNLHLWDDLIPLLPAGLKIIRYDTRGHGLTDCPTPPYSMGALITDAERLLDALNIRDCVFVGLSIGGLIGQGLAVKRMDQVRALVLSNTAAKILTKDFWHNRIDTLRAQGLANMAPDIVDRWFSKYFTRRQTWIDMLAATPTDGYIGCCAAIAGTDFITPTSGLRCPTLGIAGDADLSTPPDMVRETCDLIPGSKFHLMRRVGHLPCVENPQAYADTLRVFLRDTGHL